MLLKTMSLKEDIHKLTKREKALLIRGEGNWNSKECANITLRRITFSDGPIGVRKEKEGEGYLQETYSAICFPSGAALGQTFNPMIVKEVGKELGKEAKAYHIDVLLGPAMNIKRSPLGGRNFEYYSEDPYLTSQLAGAYVQGLQSQGVGACLKHFCANSQETDRMTINEVIDERTLHEIYLRPFEDVITETNPYVLMASYNLVNGYHMTEHKELLIDYLRKKLNYDGLIISDWFAVNDPILSLKNGLDLEMPQSGEANLEKTYNSICADAEIEKKSEDAIYHLKRLSDLVVMDNSAKLDLSNGHQIAKKAALESVVLLKNQNNILPLKNFDNVLIIGKLALKPRIQGGGSSHINSYKVTSFLDLINKNISYADGYELNGNKNDVLLFEAIKKAKESEIVIIFAGFLEEQETESVDKTSLSLPISQLELIHEISKVNKKIILVIESGSVCEMPFIDEVSAIFYTSLGGEAINEALYELILGKENPSGHLAETFPLKLSDNPTFTYFPGDGVNVLYKEALYVGYRYYQTFHKNVLFPFGYGLSYSSFQIQSFSLNEKLEAVVELKNICERRGKAVIQIYVTKPKNQIYCPKKELIAFQKLELNAREEKRITIPINKKYLSYYDVDEHCFRSLYGKYIFTIGFHADDEQFIVDWVYGGDDRLIPKKSYAISNIHEINDDQFKTLFTEELPLIHESKEFGLDISFKRAQEKGSKGAKLFISLISKVKSIRKNKVYYHSILESPIRVLVYAVPILAKKDAKVIKNIINDKHYIWNLLKMLLLMVKFALTIGLK